MWVELCPLKRYDQVLTPKTYAYDLSLHFLVDDDSECLFMCLFAILFGEVSVHVLLISNWIFFFLLFSFAGFFKSIF